MFVSKYYKNNELEKRASCELDSKNKIRIEFLFVKLPVLRLYWVTEKFKVWLNFRNLFTAGVKESHE